MLGHVFLNLWFRTAKERLVRAVFRDKKEHLLPSGELRTHPSRTAQRVSDHWGRGHDRVDWIDSLFEAHL